jgi:hypothetical protein
VKSILDKEDGVHPDLGDGIYYGTSVPPVLCTYTATRLPGIRVLHVCKPATQCICSVTDSGPKEQCPKHGHPWPPRCDRGHFLRWDSVSPPPTRRFVCYFYPLGWLDIRFGIHLNLKGPYFDLHAPFGFFRFGWVKAVHGK